VYPQIDETDLFTVRDETLEKEKNEERKGKLSSRPEDSGKEKTRRYRADQQNRGGSQKGKGLTRTLIAESGEDNLRKGV